MQDLPNILLITTDQQRADLSAREGFPLDALPFCDSLARRGVWFDHAYTVAPVCAPARVSLLTGRYPSATHVRTNHNIEDASYDQDLVDVLKARGYATALVGKNHSHLTPDRVDYWSHYGHSAGLGRPDRTPDEEAFDKWLDDLHHWAADEPTPFPLESQGPYRAVSDAIRWIRSQGDRPFFLWLTFAEPHNPYQVSEPYYSLFPPESLPPVRTDKSALEHKGSKFQLTRRLGEMGIPPYEELIPRTRSNYLGMLRLIDDQLQRLFTFLAEQDLQDRTLCCVTSDHGDFVGEYGLVRKGPEMPEVLMRVPMIWAGPGISSAGSPHGAHVSLADVMPTICEAIGERLPVGVQGRSLWPILTGSPYPAEEFTSVYAEQGFGGLHYVAGDDRVPLDTDGLHVGVSFDELNSHSQSGTMRMVRCGDWKLVMDMQGRGQLYDLARDPLEMENLYGQPACALIERDLLADLLAWTLRVHDPLPLPRRRYVIKTDPRNYWSS